MASGVAGIAALPSLAKTTGNTPGAEAFTGADQVARVGEEQSPPF